MQNTKINYLVCQATYEAVEVALGQNDHLSETISLSKHEASAQLIPAMQSLIDSAHLTVQDLSFIASNQGPGPFTTLRVVLATANGLSFASGVPLIGVDGLQAMMEQHNISGTITISLFNAFGQDAYFGIDDGVIRKTGWKNIEILLRELKETYSVPLHFIGSGALFFEKQIHEILESQAVVASPLPLAPSIKILSSQALEMFKSGSGVSQQLLPLYLKQPVLQNRTIKFS